MDNVLAGDIKCSLTLEHTGNTLSIRNSRQQMWASNPQIPKLVCLCNNFNIAQPLLSISGERFGTVQNGKNDEKEHENYFQTGKITKKRRAKSHNTTLHA